MWLIILDGIILLVLTKIIFGEVNVCENECLCNTEKEDPNNSKELSAICSTLPTLLPQTITVLNVKGNIKKINKTSMAGLTHLTELGLSGCQISKIESETFSELQFLKIINLSSNNLDVITNSTFGNIPSLTELYLDRNQLSIIHDGAFNELHSLKILNLENNKLSDVPLGLPPDLEKLDLSNNQIKNMVLKVKNLESLNLCGNPMLMPPDSIYEQSKLTKLHLGNKLLDVSGNKTFWSQMTNVTFSASDLNQTIMTNTMKSALAQMEDITHLNLENYITDSLDFLTSMHYLSTLELKKISVSRELNMEKVLLNKYLLADLSLDYSPEIAHYFLNSSVNIPNLMKLSLKNSNIRRINYMSSYKILKNLRALDLRDNPIDCYSKEWQWLIQKVETYKNFLIHQEKVVCHYPEEFKDKPILDSLKIISMKHFEEQEESIETTSKREFPYELQSNLTHTNYISENQRTTAYTVVGTVCTLVICGVLFYALYQYKKKKENVNNQDEIFEISLQPMNTIPNERFVDTKQLSS